MVQTDRLFSHLDLSPGEFAFDENVAKVFDDMIQRSIPLYSDVQRSIPILTELLDHKIVRIFDLGCSTGTSLIHLARTLPHRNMQLTGIDNSEAMLAKCREKLAALELSSKIQVFHGDVQDFQFSDASVVLMNYTLQFVDVRQRKNLLSRIADSILPGGFLLVSEKVIHHDPVMDDALVELYFEYKRRHGYSELEISRKRDALENVLIPLTVNENIRMFRDAGFQQIELLLKWFNFATFVCRI